MEEARDGERRFIGEIKAGRNPRRAPSRSLQVGSQIGDVAAFLDAYWERWVKPAGLRSLGSVRSQIAVLKEHLGHLPLAALEEPDAINQFKTESRDEGPRRPLLYARSSRVYRGLDELTYPFHDQTILVTRCGRICFKGRKVNLSHVFAGQSVGVTQFGERIWLVTFMQYDLACFDDETCRLELVENPFGPKVLPVRPE